MKRPPDKNSGFYSPGSLSGGLPTIECAVFPIITVLARLLLRLHFIRSHFDHSHQRIYTVNFFILTVYPHHRTAPVGASQSSQQGPSLLFHLSPEKPCCHLGQLFLSFRKFSIFRLSKNHYSSHRISCTGNGVDYL